MTTPEQLAAIEARALAATEGPWAVEDDPLSDGYLMIRQAAFEPGNPDGVAAVINHEATATFIAHARMDVPALLTLARERQALLDKVAALHVPNAGHNPSCDCGIAAGAGARCCGCYTAWPCPTIAALTATEGAR